MLPCEIAQPDPKYQFQTALDTLANYAPGCRPLLSRQDWLWRYAIRLDGALSADLFPHNAGLHPPAVGL